MLPRVLAIAEKQKNGPAFACISLLGVLAAALASESVGLSMALGTFLLGATLSLSSFGHRIAAIVGPVQDTLLALFFLSVGLSVDLQVVSQTWAPLLFTVVAILLMKLVVVFALGWSYESTRGMRCVYHLLWHSVANSASSCSAQRRQEGYLPLNEQRWRAS